MYHLLCASLAAVVPLHFPPLLILYLFSPRCALSLPPLSDEALSVQWCNSLTALQVRNQLLMKELGDMRQKVRIANLEKDAFKQEAEMSTREVCEEGGVAHWRCFATHADTSLLLHLFQLPDQSACYSSR